MPSAWITKRQTRSGARYRVMFRAGGRESLPRYAGSFPKLRDALARRSWVLGELAAIVEAVGRLAMASAAWLGSLDLNPLLYTTGGFVAVDALAVLKN